MVESRIELVPYTPDMAKEWDCFVFRSTNGTFLHRRPYMDYHSERFRDVSLTFRNQRGQMVGALPANLGNDGVVSSHAGLTYGGLLRHHDMCARDVEAAFAKATDYYRDQLGATAFRYKAIPHIYHERPAEDDLYVLHQMGARLTVRTLSTTLPLYANIPMQTLRRRGIAKAQRAGITVKCVEADDHAQWADYWRILCTVLESRHGVKVVHTLDEMLLLASRFPDEIKAFLAYTSDGRVTAGSVVYLAGRVAHTQYLATNDEGMQTGALDAVIARVIDYAGDEGYCYLDFGVSTEDNGRRLNHGLVFQKEGFGGRGTCYDTYELTLTPQP